MSNYRPPYNRRPQMPCQNTQVMNECSCNERQENTCENDFSEFPLAMAYVPWQSWGNLYDNCKGFARGTIFKDLDLDFLGRRCS